MKQRERLFTHRLNSYISREGPSQKMHQALMRASRSNITPYFDIFKVVVYILSNFMQWHS